LNTRVQLKGSLVSMHALTTTLSGFREYLCNLGSYNSINDAFMMSTALAKAQIGEQTGLGATTERTHRGGWGHWEFHWDTLDFKLTWY